MTGPVVVTGSSGHIGRALCARLAEAGRTTRGIDRVPGPQTDVVADLADRAFDRVLDEACAGATAVVHGAALHAPHVGRFSEADFESANVVATERLLDAAARSGVERFVFLSTTSVYGDALDQPGRTVWVDESLTPLPRDAYDRTKLRAEAEVADRHTVGLATITLRVARCFPEPKPTTVINRLHRGVSLADVLTAIELAATVPLSGHAVVNASGPRRFERDDLDRLATEAHLVIEERWPGLTAEFEARGWALPRSLDRVYDADRAGALLGYRPVDGVAAALGQR